MCGVNWWRFTLLLKKINQSVEENVHDRQPADEVYLSDIRVTNVSKNSAHMMAAETSWHRYETKLRHHHPMYTG